MTSQSREARFWEGHEASSSKNDLCRAHYQVLRTIREGSFASIKLAKHLPTDTLVAVKVLEKLDSTFFATELDILRSVEHPNIVKLYEEVETEERLYLVIEYMDRGDLADYLDKMDRLAEDEARGLFRQILRAVKYCHDNGIAHRDLKAENILLDSRGTAKLCDFGLSTWFLPGQQLDRQCGTMAYLAPEMFRQESYQGPKVDVWSLGVLLYYMVMGNVPYKGKSWTVLSKQVLSGKLKIRKSFSPELQGMLAYLMASDPKRRPTVWQVMRHPWFKTIKGALPCPSQPALNQPDPAILHIMVSYMGFNPEEVRAALSGRTFNNKRATYSMLKEQQDEARDLIRPMWYPLPGPPPCPSPAHPSPQSVLVKRASAPVRHPAVCLRAKQQQEEGGRHTRSVSLPCLLRRTSITGTERKTEGSKPPSTPAAATRAAATALPMGQPGELTCPAPEQERQVGSRAGSLPRILYNTWTGLKRGKRDIGSAAPGPKASDLKGTGGDTEGSSQLPSGPPPSKMSAWNIQPEMEDSTPPLPRPAANGRGSIWKRLKRRVLRWFERMCCCCLLR
ncbi:sperm motility kinase 4A-like [Dipodomys spectabilis]|uniref:sperm motility kinase 4A-like n=1 Tax=Dipodomys spectabilis TaxID=105255 RepID=UPI001C53CF32|nr:sperm motility kinase 4A-like [Dipodomys spectabilis]